MSSIERLPQPFQLRGSETRELLGELSNHASMCRTVPAGSSGAASSS